MPALEHHLEFPGVRWPGPPRRVAFTGSAEATVARLAVEPLVGSADTAPDDRVAHDLPVTVSDIGTCAGEVVEQPGPFLDRRTFALARGNGVPLPRPRVTYYASVRAVSVPQGVTAQVTRP